VTDSPSDDCLSEDVKQAMVLCVKIDKSPYQSKEVITQPASIPLRTAEDWLMLALSARRVFSKMEFS
jgi:hypothetical protein